jgi:hypothetical protein
MDWCGSRTRPHDYKIRKCIRVSVSFLHAFSSVGRFFGGDVQKSLRVPGINGVGTTKKRYSVEYPVTSLSCTRVFDDMVKS